MNTQTERRILIHARACLRAMEAADFWRQRLSGTRTGANARIQMHRNLDHAEYQSRRAFAAGVAA